MEHSVLFHLSYTHVFKYVKKHIFNLECKSFTTDYEKALKNAIRSCFPSSKRVSCWFHYTQAVRKKVSKLPSLFHLIRTNPDVAKLYFKFQSLPLLRHDFIESAFESLDKDVFIPFVDYFHSRWMIRVIYYNFYCLSTTLELKYYFININSRKDQNRYQYGC